MYENEPCPELSDAETDSSFVIQHTLWNVSFLNKQIILLPVRVEPGLGQDPRTTPGLLKTHNGVFVLGVPAWVNMVQVKTAVCI